MWPLGEGDEALRTPEGAVAEMWLLGGAAEEPSLNWLDLATD